MGNDKTVRVKWMVYRCSTVPLFTNCHYRLHRGHSTTVSLLGVLPACADNSTDFGNNGTHFVLARKILFAIVTIILRDLCKNRRNLNHCQGDSVFLDLFFRTENFWNDYSATTFNYQAVNKVAARC